MSRNKASEIVDAFLLTLIEDKTRLRYPRGRVYAFRTCPMRKDEVQCNVWITGRKTVGDNCVITFATNHSTS